MTDSPPPGRRAVFLGRSSYRQRRLRDALKLLPVLGAVLWFVPLLWPRGAEGTTTSAALLWVFAAWAGLIVLAFGLSLVLRPDAQADQPREDAEEGG